MQSCQKIKINVLITSKRNSCLDSQFRGEALKLTDEAAEIFTQAARKTQGKAQEVGNLLGDLLNPDMLPAEGVSVKTSRSPLEKISEPKKIVTVDSNGKPSGTRFRDDYEAHIKERDFGKTSQRSGVNGSHNMKDFEQYDIAVNPTLTKDSVKIISKTPHPTVKGIYKIKYEMPVLNRTQTPTGQWRNRTGIEPFEKTVYDPSIVSDKQMAQWGREAFADAAQNGFNGTSGNKWKGTASNGLEFVGYVDKQGNSSVRTFYPDF